MEVLSKFNADDSKVQRESEQRSTEEKHSLKPSPTLTDYVSQLEEALSKKRLEEVCLLLGGWLWEMDSEMRFSYLTDSVKAIAGREPSWHYGKTRPEVGTLDHDCPRIRKHFEQLQNCEVFDHTLTCPR